VGEVGEGLLHLADVFEEVAEVVEDLGEGGGEGKGFAESGDGVKRGLEAGEVEEEAGGGGVALDGGEEVGEGSGLVAEGLEGDAEVVVCGGVAGVASDSAQEGRD
jgi:hypothetical protein